MFNDFITSLQDALGRVDELASTWMVACEMQMQDVKDVLVGEILEECPLVVDGTKSIAIYSI